MAQATTTSAAPSAATLEGAAAPSSAPQKQKADSVDQYPSPDSFDSNDKMPATKELNADVAGQDSSQNHFDAKKKAPPSKKRKANHASQYSSTDNGDVKPVAPITKKYKLNYTKQQPPADKKPADHNAEKPGDQSEEKPADQNGDKPADQDGEKPADQSTAKPKRTPRKRKADDADQPASPDGGEKADEAPAAKKRKRAADASVDKPKKASPKKAKATATAQESKATMKGKGKKVEDTGMPPPSLPPAQIDHPVACKVWEVNNFIKHTNQEGSKLERDLTNRDLISVPHHILIGAVMKMRVHYEVGLQQDASVSDIEEAIVNRSGRPIGQSTEDVDWFTIDSTKETAFEANIKQKIARHGLDDKSLLEIELEMHTRSVLTHFGQLEEEDHRWDADRFLETFEKMWKRGTAAKRTDDYASQPTAGSKEEIKSRSLSVSDSGELGRVGVCVAPPREI
ncbi:hypothetical protein LTR37_018390 [Vermiconidia calcicola]|uniref:Uncharacterized protein n=1 Tax=Vermiconidia calcicola TaxID=1690605 RepID=A0ACC3MJ19_9PEZI|nr:hypothetical protein LTR37_018390 [Vermiconidia calcicola]